MKRTLILILCLTFCLPLASCAHVDYALLNEAAQATHALEKYSADYYIEVSLSDGSVNLLYLNGSYSIDKANKLLTRDSSQTYLGDAWHETEQYDGEALYNAEGDDKYRVVCTFEQVLEQTVYATVPVIDQSNISRLSVSQNASGTLYKFTAKDMAEYEFNTVGDSIYTLAALRKPQKDLTQYSDLDCEYTVGVSGDEQYVTGWQVSYRISLFDTPPYAAGTKQDINDYRLDITVRIRVKIKSIGQEILMPTIDKDTYTVIESSQDTNQ